MSQQKLLKEVIDILNKNKIPYMLTGSIVSSLQGEPRLTHDIDIIIMIVEKDINKISSAFPGEHYYLSESTIKQAIRDKGQFNIISIKEGDKIDFWILTDKPFDKSRFSRRQKENFLGFEIIVSSPEDTILEKLYWSKLSGGSEKQFTDALRVFEIQYEKLDIGYLKYWADRLKIAVLLEKIISKAEIMSE